MAPKRWTTSPQLAYLTLQLPDFIRRQAQKKQHLFWGAMEEGWFSRFPERAVLGLPGASDSAAPPLTAEESESLGQALSRRKKQLKSWFIRERKKIRTGTAVPGKKLTPLAKALTKRTAPVGRRVHQAKEIFQIRNKDAIRAELTERGHDELNEAARVEARTSSEAETLEEQNAAVRMSRGERMRMRSGVVSELWANASAEEREAVRVEISRERAALAAEQRRAEERLGEANGKKTPEEYQDGVDGIDELFEEAHALTIESSGWVGITLLGGPTPRLGGECTVKVICSGETPAGNSFAEACEDFEQGLLGRFKLFVERVFSARECNERAIVAAAPPAEVVSDTADAAVDDSVAPQPKPKPKRIPKPKAAEQARHSTSLPGHLAATAPSAAAPFTPVSSAAPTSPLTTSGSPRLGAPASAVTPPAAVWELPSAGSDRGSLERLSASLDEEFGPDFLQNLGGGFDPGPSFEEDNPFSVSDLTTAGDGWLAGGDAMLPRWDETYLPAIRSLPSVGSSTSVYAPSALFAAFHTTPKASPTISAPASMRRKVTAWTSPARPAAVTSGPTYAARALAAVVGVSMPPIASATPPASTSLFIFPSIPPATSIINSAPPTIALATPAIPAVTPAMVAPVFTFPTTRPATKVPAPQAPAAVRGGKALGGTDDAAPKRGRGRPPNPKPAVPTALGETEGEEGALGDATNSEAVSTAVFTVSSTNNNGARLRKENGEKKQAEAEKAARKAENMRLHNPAGETPLVIVPVPRAVRERRAAKFLDGTLVVLAPKVTRAQQQKKRNEPSESALLARAGKKRPAAAEGPSKSKKCVSCGYHRAALMQYGQEKDHVGNLRDDVVLFNQLRAMAAQPALIVMLLQRT
ncbi:hypothetical protein DFH09DRAFT_1332378 [Mycena vulgaris]|nr:hypothetical protein DFH09DRAFT_1332378 [Mycena vulgaris]